MPAFDDDNSPAEFGYFFSVNIVMFLWLYPLIFRMDTLPVSETNLSLPVLGKGRSVFG